MTWAHQLPIAFDIFTSLRTIDSSRSCLHQLLLTCLIYLTRYYHQKLTGLHKEMLAMSDRSASMKSRALRLLDAKQEEALRYLVALFVYGLVKQVAAWVTCSQYWVRSYIT